MSEVHDARGESLREEALRRIKKRHDFHGHLLVYVLVNTFIVVIWAVTSPHAFFWPIFPIAAWGIGVVMNAWDVYVGIDVREDQVEREVRRLQRRP